MKRIYKMLRNGNKGFTLMELLIVIAILGVLATVVVPNVSSFTSAGNIGAANSEVASVKTASMAYLANIGSFPGSSNVLCPPTGDYLSDCPVSTYSFDVNTGRISPAPSDGWATKGLSFNTDNQTWIKS